MKVSIVMTVRDNGELVEKTVGEVEVTMKTNFRRLHERLAERYFGGMKFHIRIDSSLFGYTAVAKNGDTIHLM